jgi:hypothetical protein
MNFHIPQELITNFNDIVYYNEPHKYYLDNKELISVTTLIHQYQEPFDEEYWSEIKSKEFNIPKYEILRAWNFINKKGTMKGSLIHDYSENKLLNKVFKYPQSKIINRFGFDPIKREYDITKKHVDNFLKKSKNKHIPIKTELVVYDVESMVSGMLDLLFWNVKEKEFQIWDWKTNKEFSFENKKQNLLNCLNALEDCDLEIYSLQLECYKYIIEKNTNIKLGNSYLVWLSHNNDDFQIIPALNRSFYVKEIFKNRMLNVA